MSTIMIVGFFIHLRRIGNKLVVSLPNISSSLVIHVLANRKPFVEITTQHFEIIYGINKEEILRHLSFYDDEGDLND